MNGHTPQMIGPWQVHTHKDTGKPYYHNTITGTTTYEKPKEPTDEVEVGSLSICTERLCY